MAVKDVIKKVKKDYQLTESEFLKKSTLEFLLKRKSEIETDILGLLDKNKVSTIDELQKLVETDREHPEWEDLISLENLHSRLIEIQNDIKSLS
jgi:hypothetical protein